MKKSLVALIVLVGMIMSSCAFTTVCPTYSKKEKKDIRTTSEVRI